MANIFRVYKDSQVTADRIRAENAAARLDNAPERRLYVFGNADDLFPYFSTFANALTYANTLSPSTTNPVSIVLLSKSDNTPVTITGNDDWYALCLDGIYVSSPYREIFSTTTLPTTLPRGMRVMYEDAIGVESLWVGNADGVAWPAVGYKEYVATLTQTGTGAPVPTVLVNTIGGISFARNNVGVYQINSTATIGTRNHISFDSLASNQTLVLGDEIGPIIWANFNNATSVIFTTLDATFVPQDEILDNTISIRIYP